MLCNSMYKSLINKKLECFNGKRFLARTVYDFQYINNNDRTSILSVIKRWSNKFETNGISVPVESIEYITAHVLGYRTITEVNNASLKYVTSEQLQRIQQLCRNRMQNMPIQYVIGQWDFRELRLKMKPPVFIPRPETETLVDIVMEDELLAGAAEGRQVLEVGCGTGAISLALLKHYPKLKVTALDQSRVACDVTSENARDLGVGDRLQVLHSQVTEQRPLPEEAVHTRYDLIVSNPPYVRSGDMLHLQKEIKMFEDLGALDGGEDGLSVIRLLIQMACSNLVRGGSLYLEVDACAPHAEIVPRLLLGDASKKGVLQFVKSYRDFCGRDRFLRIRRL